MRRNYRISDLKDYINWVYFFHAWSLPQQSEEGQRLYDEAQHMLQRLQPYLKVKTVVEILPAWSEGDDIVVQPIRPCECGQSHPCGEPVHLPMLRQQRPGASGACLSLADFVQPRSMGKTDRVGAFAATVDAAMSCAVGKR